MSFSRDLLPDLTEYFEQQGLQLKGPGTWGTTRCEFHDGSESMRVKRTSGAWVCMPCGVKGGDVLAYEIQRHGADFVDASKVLGEWVDLRMSPGVWGHQISLGPRAIGWPATEIEALNAARISGKTDDEIRLLVRQLETARKTVI